MKEPPDFYSRAADMEEPHIVEQMLFRKTTSAGKISADREPDLMIPAMP
jgi:hypothetical protein